MTDPMIITRTFDAPRERVWEAWTRPEHFSRWFGTEAVEVPLDTVSLDVRIGGAWKAVMHLPDGGTIDWEGEFTEVDPPARLALTMNDDPSADAGEPVTVDLTEVDGGTEMTLTQTSPEFTDEQRERTIAGYDDFFDVIEKLLAERA